MQITQKFLSCYDGLAANYQAQYAMKRYKIIVSLDADLSSFTSCRSAAAPEADQSAAAWSAVQHSCHVSRRAVCLSASTRAAMAAAACTLALHRAACSTDDDCADMEVQKGARNSGSLDAIPAQLRQEPTSLSTTG
jgi:hypothetical protein